MTGPEAKPRPKPRAPAGLGTAGKALWARLTGEFVFAPGELVVLGLAAAQIDDVAALEKAVAEDGTMVVGAAGQVRLNAAVTELRQARLAVGRLIGLLALPDEDERPMSNAAKRAQRAAVSRWDPTAAVREGRRGGTAS